MDYIAHCLTYSEYGDPLNVLHISQEVISEPIDDEVVVKVIGAPINPADIKTIDGTYAIKVILPAVGGNEFLAEVQSIGTNVKNLKVNDKVVAFYPGLGTWRTYGKYSEKFLLKIPDTIPVEIGATLTVNPCTAYRMLKDYVPLKPGDTVIQNGANSAVGQAVIQFCKAWKINCVGIIRDRPNKDELIQYLKDLGATEIVTEQEFQKTELFSISKLSKPILALNCVGGESVRNIIKHLENGATVVTYGGMSGQPIITSVQNYVYQDIKMKGFWMTRWTRENFDNPIRLKMFEEIIGLIENGLFKPPKYEIIGLNDYKSAFKDAMKGFTGKKFIINFS